MSDFLTHLFLPLTVVYVLWPERFPTPLYLALGMFGLLSDFDKVLGHPGLLHSLVTLVPIGLAVIAAERWSRDELRYAPVILVLVFSHLILDIVDGGPVPLLAPLVETGIGFQYPATTVFSPDFPWISIRGPLLELRTSVPRTGFNTYGFINGFGVTSLLVFLTVYFARQIRHD